MAGLLYLPRLMVYHCDCDPGSDRDLTFKVMERRLYRAIMTPAMLVTLISGGLLIWLGGWDFSNVWLVAKLSAVLLMVVFHFVMGRHLGAFALGQRSHSGRYFRVLNEVPTLLMIVIVICVIVKPFG
jgi:protoporphyrinogen IX oxidase